MSNQSSKRSGNGSSSNNRQRDRRSSRPASTASIDTTAAKNWYRGGQGQRQSGAPSSRSSYTSFCSEDTVVQNRAQTETPTRYYRPSQSSQSSPRVGSGRAVPNFSRPLNSPTSPRSPTTGAFFSSGGDRSSSFIAGPSTGSRGKGKAPVRDDAARFHDSSSSQVFANMPPRTDLGASGSSSSRYGPSFDAQYRSAQSGTARLDQSSAARGASGEPSVSRFSAAGPSISQFSSSSDDRRRRRSSSLGGAFRRGLKMLSPKKGKRKDR